MIITPICTKTHAGLSRLGAGKTLPRKKTCHPHLGSDIPPISRLSHGLSDSGLQIPRPTHAFVLVLFKEVTQIEEPQSRNPNPHVQSCLLADQYCPEKLLFYILRR